ncbi:MAG: quinoprotein dehydrogenase-associated SoxYZ-like carrier [Pseudomonadota bacterium]
MLSTLRPSLLAAALVLVSPIAASATEAWSYIKPHLYGDAEVQTSDIVTLEAPYRAEDAALVPMTIGAKLPDDDPRRVESITLVIDNNPSPVAATFTLGADAAVSSISTRVRVDRYTPVRAIAKLSDGSLHMTETYVKASGGCSAPMAKDQDDALANMGKMRLRWFNEAGHSEPKNMSKASAQLMIRHPNNSGLQMDQITRYYIPAHFVTKVSVSQGGDQGLSTAFELEAEIGILGD